MGGLAYWTLAVAVGQVFAPRLFDKAVAARSPTVALIVLGILAIVILVVLLGLIKSSGWANGRDDGFVKAARLVEGLFAGCG